MYMKKLCLCAMLAIAHLTVAHEDPCQRCPKPCPKATTEELDNLSFNANQSYARKKELLHAIGAQDLSTKDLEEVLQMAKEQGDFETHAEAYHRIKIEVGTEDEGQTLVIKLKEIGFPVAVTAVLAAAVGAFCTHYFGPAK